MAEVASSNMAAAAQSRKRIARCTHRFSPVECIIARLEGGFVDQVSATLWPFI